NTGWRRFVHESDRLSVISDVIEDVRAEVLVCQVAQDAGCDVGGRGQLALLVHLREAIHIGEVAGGTAAYGFLHAGVNDAGSERDNAHTVILGVQDTGIVVQRRFGGAVNAPARGGIAARAGRDIHDTAVRVQWLDRLQESGGDE